MKAILMVMALFPGLALAAAPQLNIGGLYDYLEGNRSTLLKRIRNGGDGTAFIKVSVSEVLYDADGQPREVSLEGLPPEQRGLLASPARLIVPAHGLQSVRLLYRGERSRERYFRLRFMPVLPEVDEGFDVTADQAQRYENELSAGVNILAGYGSLLFVRPEHTQFLSRITQQEHTFTVVNDGNATVVLDHFNNCRPDGQECSAATKHHVLGNTHRVFDKHQGRSYQFELIEGKDHRRVEFEG